MAAESSWSLRGIDPRAREAARAAARREGVTIGEWLNRQLLAEANGEADDELGRDPRDDRTSAPANSETADSAAVAAALDRLTRRIEASEQRSTMAITGMDQSVLGVISRLQNAEDAHAEFVERTEDALDAFRASQDKLSERIGAREADNSGREALENIDGLQDALTDIAARVTQADAQARARAEDLENTLADSRAEIVRVSDELTKRLDTTNEHAGLQVRRLREDVERTLDTRLDKLEEQVRGDAGQVDEVLATLEAAVTRVTERLDETEGASREGIRALEETLAPLDERLVAFEKRVEAFDPAVVDKLRSELKASRDEVAAVAQRADAARARVEDVVRNARADADEVAARTRTEVEAYVNDAVSGVNETVADLKASAGDSEDAAEARETAFAAAQRADDALRLAEEARAAAQQGVNVGEVNAIADRLADLDQAMAHQAQSLREEMGRQAAATPDDMTERLNVLTDNLQELDRRHANAVEHLSGELARMASVVDNRLKETEERAEALAKAGGASPQAVETLVAQRVNDLEEASAGAIERVGDELARLSERLHDKLAASERRAAENLEEVSAQVSRVFDKVSTQTDDLASDLADRLKASEERTGRMVEEALENVHRRIEESQDQTAAALSPVQRALQGLTERLDALETGEPSERITDSAAAAARSFAVDPPPFDTARFAGAAESEDRYGEADVEGDDADGPFGSSTPEELSSAPPDSPFRGGHEGEDDADDIVFSDDEPPFDEDKPRYGEAGFDESPFGDPFEEDTASSVIERPGSQSEREEDTSFMSVARRAAQNAVSGRDGELGEDLEPGFGPAVAAPEKSGGRKKIVLASASFGILAVVVLVGALVIDGGQDGARETVQPPTFDDEDFAVAPRETNTGPTAFESAPRALPAPETAPAIGVSELDAIEPVQTEPEPEPVVEAAPDPEPVAALPAPEPEPEPTPEPEPEPEPAPAASTGVTIEQAASEGNPIAQYQLGETRLQSGDPGGVNLILQAAENGLAPAQYRLSKLFENGQGVDTDMDQAFRWTRRAAAAGHRKAMHNLGIYHAEGRGASQDFREAASWFRNAADLGATDSQYNLAVLFEQGLGVELSLPEAYTWYSIAARAGDSDAARRAAVVAARLTPSDKAAADAEIERFRPKNLDRAVNGLFGPQAWETPQLAGQAAIARAQTLLNQLGYSPGTPDGQMGPNTRRAIIAYQRSHGLEQTGSVTTGFLQHLEASAAN